MALAMASTALSSVPIRLYSLQYYILKFFFIHSTTYYARSGIHIPLDVVAQSYTKWFRFFWFVNLETGRSHGSFHQEKPEHGRCREEPVWMQQKGFRVFVNHCLRIGHCGSLVVHLLSGWMAGDNQYISLVFDTLLSCFLNTYKCFYFFLILAFLGISASTHLD